MTFPDEKTPGFMKAEWVMTTPSGEPLPELSLWLKKTDISNDKIYHYTDLNALLGIIANNGMWLSNIRFLNDSEEYENGINLFEEVAQMEEVKNEKILFIKKAITVLRSGTNANECFVSSYSTDGDSLEMWRGYGQNGKGIAIEFDNTNRKLEGHFGGLQFVRLGRVIYDNDIKIRLLLSTSKRYTKEYHSCPYVKRYKKENNNMMLADIEKDYVESLANSITTYLSLFKHSSFSGEKEARVVYRQNLQDNSRLYSKVKYRVSGHMIVPYFESQTHNLPQMYGNNLLPITKIILGPKTHKCETANSIEEFLANNNYPDVKVRNSSCPYRG